MQVELFILSLTLHEVFSVCAPTDLHFPDFQKQILRALPTVIEAICQSCPGHHDLYYSWKLIQMPSEIVKKGSDHVFRIHGYDYNSEDVFVHEYRLIVTVSHYEDFNPSTTFSATFKFVPDDLYISIKGGIEVSHPINIPLVVDAKSFSRDASYPPNEDAFKGDTVKWSVSPPIPGFSPTTSLIQSIPAWSLKLNAVYKFEVNVTRTKIPGYVTSKSGSQTVKITPEGTPYFDLECIRNCIAPNPKERTALRVVCHVNCDNLKYKWDLEPKLDPSQTDFGDGFSHFVILPDVIEEGTLVRVSVEFGLAKSVVTLQFISNFKKGTCYITPKKGTALKTVFEVKCKNFFSSRGILVYEVFQKSVRLGKYVMLGARSGSAEQKTILTVGFPVSVLVRIIDPAYMQHEVYLSTSVSFIPINSRTISEIIKDILGDDNSSLMSLMLQKNRNKIMQIIACFLPWVYYANDTVVFDLHKHTAEILLSSKAQDFVTATQLITILEELAIYKNPKDTVTGRFASVSLPLSGKAVKSYLYLDVDDTDCIVPESVVIKFGEDAFEVAIMLIQEVVQLQETLNKVISNHDYDSYDDMSSTKLLIRDNLRVVTENILALFQTIGTSLLRKTIPNEKPIIIKSNLTNLHARRVLLTKDGVTISMKSNRSLENKVILPAALNMELLDKYSFIDCVFGVMNFNPFWWHQNKTYFHTEIMTFDIYYKLEKITTTKNPLQVHMKALNVPNGIIKGNIEDGNMIVHRLFIELGGAVIVVFKASDESYKVTTSTCYCNKEDFNKGIEIRRNSTESERTLRINFEDDTTMLYICVIKSEGKGGLEYEGIFAMFSCAYWDSDIGKWNYGYSKLVRASIENNSDIVCEYWHMSFFAGHITVPPISLNSVVAPVFYIIPFENWVAPFFVIASVVVWIALLGGAVILDRKLEKRNIVKCLDDNIPGDSHAYLLVVFTGYFLDAGTTADVGFQIFGEEANSRSHLIKCKGMKLLQRNSQDWLIMHSPSFLGELKKIRLWHNCKGIKPHWYCQKIIVQHLKSGAQYCFIVEKWFSLIWGDGKIEREIPKTEKIFLNPPKVLFIQNFEKQITDENIWLSVFIRDPQSNFSSTERVGALICGYFTGIVVCSMFYGVPQNDAGDLIDPRSGYFLTFYDLFTILGASLSAVPLTLLIILMFRHSCPYRHRRLRKEFSKRKGINLDCNNKSFFNLK